MNAGGKNDKGGVDKRFHQFVEGLIRNSLGPKSLKQQNKYN